jgi:hypothetical protein
MHRLGEKQRIISHGPGKKLANRRRTQTYANSIFYSKRYYLEITELISSMKFWWYLNNYNHATRVIDVFFAAHVAR